MPQAKELCNLVMGEALGREQEGGESRDWQFPGNSPSTCSKRKKELGGEGERRRVREIAPWHIEIF